MTNFVQANYAQKLGISVCTIMQIKDLIFNDIRLSIEKDMLDDKQCFHIIGPAGVGKTQITYQIADRLTKHFKQKFDVIRIQSPVLNRDDFLAPYPSKNEQFFDMLYSGFIPADKNSCGLFVIDEFSRGDDRLQQLMWQIQNENKIHTFDFPKKWFVISLDNPADDEYVLNDMEDAAGLRRCLHIYTTVSVNDFLKYAKQNDFHPYIIDYIEKKPKNIYDFESQRKGMVYANPASWEKMSNHLKKYDGLIDNCLPMIQVLASGLLNTYMAIDFINFIKHKAKYIDPHAIINNYTSIQNEILNLVKNKNNNILHDCVNSVFTFLTESTLCNDEQCKNLAKFLLDLPKDIAASFIVKISQIEDKSSKPYINLIQTYSKMTTLVPTFNEKFAEQFNKIFS